MLSLLLLPAHSLTFVFLRTSLGSLHKRPRVFASYVVASLVVSLGHALMAWATGALATQALAVNYRGGQVLPLISIALLGSIGAAFKTLGSSVTSWASATLASSVSQRLLQNIARGLLSSRSRLADLPQLIASLAAIEEAVDRGALASLRAALQILPLVALALWVIPVSAIGFLLLLIPFVIFVSWVRHGLRHQEQLALQRSASLFRDMDQLVRHAELWKTFGASNSILSSLTRRGDERGSSLASSALRRALASGLNEVFAALLLVVAVLVWPHVGGATASLIPFAAAVFLMYRPLRELGEARGILFRGSMALDELSARLCPDSPPGTLLNESATIFRESFEPPTRQWSLLPLKLMNFGATWHSVRWSLNVEPGEMLAVVGPNGSGKTTLLRSLLGLETTCGQLVYGDINLENQAVGPSFRPFAWAPQDAPIVRGTLEENIALGINSADSQERAHQARCDLESIWGRSLDGALTDRFLEGVGFDLSAGEKAFVSIARSIATGLPVILLDEPTANLDPESERRVLALLRSLRNKRTLIIVTHRAAPRLAADRVVLVPSEENAE